MSGDGMSALVTALTAENAITSSTLWTEVAGAAPLMITLFIFAFGFRIIRKLYNNGAKGKAKIG